MLVTKGTGKDVIKSSKKTLSRARVIRKLDDLVRDRCYERDGHRCVRCSGRSALTPSHVYPKGRYQNLRWLDINILTMCWPCHRYFWHDNPPEAMEWFEKNWGDRLRLLRTLKDTMPKPDARELLQSWSLAESARDE